MGTSHAEIAKKFATRKPNSRHQGKVVWAGGRVFCNEDVIYSYGGHFPMALYLGTHAKYGHYFVKNSDKYSSSTSAHQSCVAAVCVGPTLSRNALKEFISFEELKLENFLFWRRPLYVHLFKRLETGVFYKDYVTSGEDSGYTFTNEWTLPKVGEFKPQRKQPLIGYEQGAFIVKEALVLKIKKKYLLCTEGSVQKLPGEPANVSEALRMRKPTTMER